MIFSLAVTLTFGAVTLTNVDTTTLAVLMPVTDSTPDSGSYSNTAPSENWT
jgi:hypothetical protein